MDPARFVYFFRDSGYAIAHINRDDLTTGQLLFTCPESWLPKDQNQFNAAARYYGVKNPERIKYDANEVPF